MKSSLRSLSVWVGLAILLPAAASFAVPANDNFDSSAVIAGFPLTATGSNVEATVESGEALPDGYEFYATKSVWFSWTAPTNGIVQIDTFGSHEDSEYWDSDNPVFHPTPSVWLGGTLETLVEVQSGGSQQSRFLNAVSGTTYRIAVFGLQNDNYDEGQIVLNITNDVSAGISGTVTDTNGVPLPGIIAQSQDPGDDYAWDDRGSRAFTDAAGNYTIRGLSNDSYRVRFSGAGFAAEFYHNVPDRYDPYLVDLNATTVLTITNGETISDIDATLAGAASVSGTVTGPGDLPLAGIEVWIYLGDDWYNQEATTDENGEYLVENLPPDAYSIRFSDPAGDYLDLRSNVVLGAGAHLAGLDVTLGVASKIAGTVIADADAAPLEGINAFAYQWTGAEWDWIGGASSDADGRFLIGGLAAGTYRIRFADWTRSYQGEVYDNAASLDSGTDVVVGAIAVVSNINASLTQASRISGTVTKPDGTTPIAAHVLLQHWNGAEWEQIDECWTGAGGEFLFAGLAAGTYRVEFTDDPYDYDDYCGAFFAEDVVLAAATAVTDIDGALAVAQPEILDVRAGPSGMDVVFSGVPTRDYILQRGILESNAWTDVGSPVYCETGTNLFSVPAPIDRIVDDFNDDVRDAAKWPNYQDWNGGAFAETNGRLEFTTTGAPPANYSCEAVLESAHVGQFNRDFTFIVDLANIAPPIEHRSGYFLVEISAANNSGNQLAVQFADWSTGQAYIGTYLRKDGYNVAGSGFYLTTDEIRLRIDFDSQTKVISTFYDVNPADADEWIPIDSFGIAGGGGADGNTDWELGETDPFVVGLRATCSFEEGADYVGLESGQVFIDNVRFIPAAGAGGDHGAWRVRRYP